MSDWLEKGKRKRRDEGLNWTPDEELAWLRDHPEDRPPDWQDPESVTHDDDLIPEVDINERTDDELQPHLDGIDILTAYRRWSGKMEPKVGSKRESIMISCPKPSHPDKNPSAWINLDKETWFCGTCQEGGDKYDIYAHTHGYSVPGYKHDGSFPKMRREMAEEFGVVISRTPGGTPVVTAPLEADVPIIQGESQEISEESESAPSLATVTPISDEIAERLLDKATLEIPWEGMFAAGTYMDTAMRAVTIDDLPHEYYFWLLLQSMATAVGAKVIMQDYLPVKANLYLVLYGRTGIGKTRATHPVLEIIREALPWTADAHTETDGTLVLPTPGSAEALIDSFHHAIQDPSTMAVVKTMPVRGILKIEEFASFAARASRHGNPMKETLIELYDAHKGDITHKTRGGGLIKARTPFAQVITTTQPKAIHNFLRRSDADSGFMNRFVFAVGTRRRERISYGGVSFDLARSKELLRDIHKWSNKAPVRYELSGVALERWSEFFKDTLVPLQEGNEESMYSRIDLTLKKLMILFAVNDKAASIGVDHVDMAISLFDYLRTTYFMFSTDIAHTEDEECCSKIIEIISKYYEQKKRPCTRRELLKRLNGKFSLTTVTSALKLLEQVDLIQFTSIANKAGPATKGYIVEK